MVRSFRLLELPPFYYSTCWGMKIEAVTSFESSPTLLYSSSILIPKAKSSPSQQGLIYSLNPSFFDISYFMPAPPGPRLVIPVEPVLETGSVRMVAAPSLSQSPQQKGATEMPALPLVVGPTMPPFGKRTHLAPLANGTLSPLKICPFF